MPDDTLPTKRMDHPFSWGPKSEGQRLWVHTFPLVAGLNSTSARTSKRLAPLDTFNFYQLPVMLSSHPSPWTAEWDQSLAPLRTSKGTNAQNASERGLRCGGGKEEGWTPPKSLELW